jgi:hypothetical protein
MLGECAAGAPSAATEGLTPEALTPAAIRERTSGNILFNDAGVENSGRVCRNSCQCSTSLPS